MVTRFVVRSAPTWSQQASHVSTATDKPGEYNVVTSRTHQLSSTLPPDSIYRINTGAPLPNGTDAVIMVEDTKVISITEDGEEARVETLAQVDTSENIRKAGSDVRSGARVLDKGTVLTSRGGEIGTLAFVGHRTVCSPSFLDTSALLNLHNFHNSGHGLS
jgi:gephyrin